MTLGELKINCYKLIDPSDEEVLAENIMSVYEQDTAYSFYFLNMNNSINSAITRVSQACILPLKRVEINYEDLPVAKTKRRITFDLREYIDDFYKIRLIEYLDSNGEATKIDYRLIGEYLDIVYRSEGSIVIYYFRKLKSLEYYYMKQELEDINQLDLTQIGLDDTTLSIIPYFVKADLLEHDKPVEAVTARNTFEQYLSNFEQPEIEVRLKQKSWWGGLL